MRIAVLSYGDEDVFDGMANLLKAYPNALVLFPITNNPMFVESVVRALKEYKNAYAVYVVEITEDIEDIVNGAVDVHVVEDPIAAVVKDLDNGDMVATVNDESDNLQRILDDINDQGLTTWNMTDKDGAPFKARLDDDFDETDLIDAMDVFVEAMVRYVTKASMEAMRETVLNGLARFMEEEDDEDDDFLN
jgi:hypothetical protein